MKKIDDRFLLGVVCGVLGNIPKIFTMVMCKKMRWAEIDGFEKGAGMFIDPLNIPSKAGQVTGVFADSVVAGVLGVMSIYGLSIMGPKRAVIKGALAGEGMWQIFYGVLANMGATRIKSVTPGTALAEFASHTIYGACVYGLAVTLGDPSIFSTKPLITVPFAQHLDRSAQSEISEHEPNRKSIDQQANTFIDRRMNCEFQ